MEEKKTIEEIHVHHFKEGELFCDICGEPRPKGTENVLMPENKITERLKVNKTRKAWVVVDDEGVIEDDITGRMRVFISKKLAEHYGKGTVVQCDITYEFYLS